MSLDLIGLASFIGAILLALSTYLNSVRKAEFDRLQNRVVDTEKRLAEAEKRAADSERRAMDNERRAEEYRNDVVQIGEAMVRERAETARRLALIVADGNAKIQKVVIVLEKVLEDVEASTGSRPDIDLDALKRLVVIDNVTGQLPPIDVQAAKRFMAD